MLLYLCRNYNISTESPLCYVFSLHSYLYLLIDRRQESRPSARKRNAKKAKWLSEEALQIAMKRSEKQRRKGKIYPFECRVPKKSKEI